MTKYRTVNNGHWDYLQYEAEYKFLFFWTKTKWIYIWKPHYNEISEPFFIGDADKYINNLKDGDLKDFVKQWPNIKDYFVQAKIKQVELIKKYNETKIELEKNKITYL